MEYLHDYSYYSDLYDLQTIKDCLNWIEIVKKDANKNKFANSPKFESSVSLIGALTETSLYYRKGDRYRNKENTINEWTEKDKSDQDKYDHTIEPQMVFCPECNWSMEVESKHLHSSYNEPQKVLFLFRCPKCKKGKGVFDNGNEFLTLESKCPICGNELEEKRTRKGEVVTTHYKCHCGYQNKEVWDMKAESEEYKNK